MHFLTRNHFIKLCLIMIISISFLVLTACSPAENNQEEQGSANESAQGQEQEVKKETLVFADAGWDSIRFHNDVAGFIIENGYDYPTDVIQGSTPATFTGLRQGDIDIEMEVWTQNIQEAYDEAISNEEIIEVSTNFDDNAQGLYVPTYVIEGDSEKGIDPMAPDLKTVKDLANYPEIFEDPEDPGMGRIYGAPPGWAVDEILRTKVENYGLTEPFNYFSPGSDTALSSSLASAYKKGEPWVGYYWEPTWVIGLYDMTLLEDEPYSDEKWENGYLCEFAPVNVTVAVNSALPEKAPEVVDFLSNYKTSSSLTSEGLAFMQENEGATTEDAAINFLKQNEDVWTKWVPEDIAKKVKDAL